MNICVLYFVDPKCKIKFNSWVDGFTSAIKLLEIELNNSITLINVYNNPTIDFTPYNVIIFKESFHGGIYTKYNKYLDGKLKCLCISSSNIIPSQNQLNSYDVLFYETYWYYKYAKLSRHPLSFHAFGVDTNIMRHILTEKKYDVIFVGTITDYKRPLKILDIEGDGDTKICIGLNENPSIVNELENYGVEVKDFIPYSELSSYYNKSKLCYLPCTLHGGGERAVLEARSCGVPVKIESDNPKLKELLTSPIYSSMYYAEQLSYGIKCGLYRKMNFPKQIKFWYKNPLTGIRDMSVSGIDFKMYSENDDTVIKILHWTNYNGWEAEELKTIKTLCLDRPYDYFLDIGTYSGIYSIFVGKLLPNTQIFGFEIIPSIIERYCKNLKLNNISAKSYNIGISNTKGKSKIKLGSFEHGMSSVSKVDKGGSIEIGVDTIDNFFKEQGLNFNSKVLIKVDVEGTEIDVLDGMKKLLLEADYVDILFETNNIEKTKKLMPNHKIKVFKTKRNILLDSLKGKKIVNLQYFDYKIRNNYNFGDALSVYITQNLLNKDKYTLVLNQPNIDTNIICIGSYIQTAKDNYYIYGSGVRTLSQSKNYNNLKVCAVRGPDTRHYLLCNRIECPEIYGDPALLLPLFYVPTIRQELKDKIGVVPHFTNYNKYYSSDLDSKYHLIDPCSDWNIVIDQICSCKSIISSSLHGLICSDAYNIPNLWLDEYKLSEGEIKFIDYFKSQNRNTVKITTLDDYDSGLLYMEGNNIDLDQLKEAFPFK